MTRTNIKLLFISALFFTLSILPILALNTLKVDAQGGGGLRIPPGPFNLTIEPGQSEELELAIRNITPAPVSVNMEVNDFESNGVDGNPVILLGDNVDENNPFSLRPYVSGPDFFSLDVDEEIKVTYTISIPEDASPGARNGLFRFIANAAESDQAGVNLGASLGTIVIVNTPGNAIELLNFQNMEVRNEDGSTGSIFESAPKRLVVTLSNEGNTFVQPYGNVTVKNWNGDTVMSYEFNEAEDERNGLLPQSQREFIKNLENISGYGKYTIEASISYGDGTNIIPATITFWVLPWKILLIALVVLVVLIIVVVRGLRFYKQRILKDQKKERFKKK